MSKRNPGGLISNTGLRKPSVTDQSQNSGVWMLEEQFLAEAKGTWANQSGQGYEIGGSLRFRASASAFLNRTPAVAGNRKTWTFSCWVKYSNIGSTVELLGSYGLDNPNNFAIEISSDKLYIGLYSVVILQSNQVFRDPSAWYNIVVQLDTTQPTVLSRCRAWVNGVEITSWGTDNRSSLTQNGDFGINSTNVHNIGRNPVLSARYLDGYLTETHLVDGLALEPTAFGYYDYNGVWQPKRYTGTYGRNGFYLPLTAGSSYSYYTAAGGSVQVAANSAFSFAGDFTLEGWFYGNVTGDRSMFVMSNGGATYLALNVQAGNGYDVYTNTASTALAIRDRAPALREWTHIAMVRSSGVIRVYTNGVVSGATLSNSSTLGYTNQPFFIGGFGSQEGGSQDAYFSNVRVSNIARYTSNFDANAVKVLNSDANTVLLTAKGSTFADVGPNNLTVSAVGTANIQRFSPISSTPGQDESGNNNDYVLNNFSFVDGPNQDGMRDSPTNGSTVEDTGLGGQLAGNYATIDPLEYSQNYITYSNANLSWSQSANGGWGPRMITKSTFQLPKTGKWVFAITIGASGNNAQMGIARPDYAGNPTRAQFGSTIDINDYTVMNPTGGVVKNGTEIVTTGVSIGVGDELQCAVDSDAGIVSWYRNGTYLGQATGMFTATRDYWPMTFSASSASAGSGSWNFGQRPFAYAAPAGFKCLNTANLPQPTIPDGKDYFDTVTYTGSFPTNNVQNSLSFAPDMVWLKSRTQTYSNYIFNKITGGTTFLNTNSAAAEGTSGDAISFDSNGFTVTAGQALNEAGQPANNMVAWNWKAGDTTVTNTAGTVTSQVRANPTAGFSIVTYTGSGATGGTVGHGLTSAPNFIIVKNRDRSIVWVCYHSAMGSGAYIFLNTTDVRTNEAGYWGSGVNSTTFGLQANNASGINYLNERHVAYCFSEVPGYSKFGSYVANGSSDGPFLYCGFRPKFILTKNTSRASQQWTIFDSTRVRNNPNGSVLFPNNNNTEYTDVSEAIDFVSNGFKHRGASTSYANHTNGDTYIYMAFAEHPFKTSRAR
jgi:hypothetical protein